MEEVKNNDEASAQSRTAEIEEENKRLEEALRKREELLKKQEEMTARDRLGGKSEAGTPAKTEDQITQEKIEADAERIKGSLFLKKKK